MEKKKIIFCNGDCTSPDDDYCGMYFEGEECPACKSIKEKSNWETLYKFLENTDKLSEKDTVMLIDLMDDIKNGLVK